MLSRILVLTGTSPGTHGVGPILIQQVLGNLPSENIALGLLNDRYASIPPSINTGAFLSIPKRFEHTFRPTNNLAGECASIIFDATIAQRYRRQTLKAIVDFAKTNACNQIFSILESPSVIRITTSLQKCLDCDLKTFVMDSPEGLARSFRYGRALKSKLLLDFDQALKLSSQIGVAGESMRDYYETKYKKKCTIFRQGLDPQNYSNQSRTAPPNLHQNSFVLGFGGSITASDAFQSLLNALDQCQWRLGNRDVKLRIIGSHLKIAPRGPQHIEHFGWRSVPDMISLLRECDFLYMPQPFSESEKDVAELSFPNKMCTYVPTGCPIALHAPPSSSLTQFYQRYSCGPISHELPAGHLLSLLEQTYSNPSLYSLYSQNVQAAFREDLNLTTLQKNVESFFPELMAASS